MIPNILISISKVADGLIRKDSTSHESDPENNIENIDFCMTSYYLLEGEKINGP